MLFCITQTYTMLLVYLVTETLVDKYRFMVVETPGITALVVAYLLLHVTSIWVIMGALNVMEGMERPAPTQE